MKKYKKNQVMTDGSFEYGLKQEDNEFIVVQEVDSEDDYCYEKIASFISFKEAIEYIHDRKFEE